MADAEGDGHDVPIELGIHYIEEGIAHVGEDDLGQFLIFLIQNVSDDLVLGYNGRSALTVVAYAFSLILYLVLEFGQGEYLHCKMALGDSSVGDLVGCDRSIQDVVSIY